MVISKGERRKTIERCLASLLCQRLRPHIVFVDDGENEPYEIKYNGIQVVKFPYKHGSWVSRPDLASVINCGLKYVAEAADYVLISGSDTSYPPDYLSYICQRMMSDGIVMASGKLPHERASVPRGSGRVVDWAWWKQLCGGRYPRTSEFEAYLDIKAGRDRMRVYDIGYDSRRVMMTPEKSEQRGRGMREIGYPRFRALKRLAYQMVVHPSVGFPMCKGYLSARKMEELPF